MASARHCCWDSNKLKHSRRTKKIRPPTSRRQHALLLNVKTYATYWPPIMHNRPSPGVLPASQSRFGIRQHPRVPPAPAPCLPSRNESPSLLFLPLLVSSRLVFAWCCLSTVCSCLPAFLSFPFLCLGLPSFLPKNGAPFHGCVSGLPYDPPLTHRGRRLRKKLHFPIAASVAHHRTAQPTSCASNGCGKRG